MSASFSFSSPAAHDGWQRYAFDSLEQHHALLKRLRPDLAWTSRQLSPGGFRGSVLAIRTPCYAIACTSSSGSFEMRGPVSTDHLVLSLAIHFPTTGRQWMRAVGSGMVGVYLPGEDVDTVNLGTVSYAVIDIPHETLEGEAAQHDAVIDVRRLKQSGVVPGRIPESTIAWIRTIVHMRDQQGFVALPPGITLQQLILATTVRHLAGVHRVEHGMPPGGYCRIVARARAWIEAHLDGPITIDDLVAAAITSRRTLHRAFVEVLGETPQTYVLKLRLNRIRQDLASPSEAARTVTTVSHRWGIPELGRLASRYREQFGELPRETLARRRCIGADWSH
jgi:AraC-like DNA-binding protein